VLDDRVAAICADQNGPALRRALDGQRVAELRSAVGVDVGCTREATTSAGSGTEDAPREHVEQRDGLDALVDDRDAGADLVEHGVERPDRSVPLAMRRCALVGQDEDLLERGLDARVDLGDVEVVVLDVLGLDRLRVSDELSQSTTDPIAELAAEQVRRVVLARDLEDESAL